MKDSTQLLGRLHLPHTSLVLPTENNVKGHSRRVPLYPPPRDYARKWSHLVLIQKELFKRPVIAETCGNTEDTMNATEVPLLLLGKEESSSVSTN
jgi:hypothetical protein